MHNENVAEAIVVGVEDEIKGEIPLAFVTLKKKLQSNEEIYEAEQNIVNKVRQEFGSLASFKTCIIVDKLPKTRSGEYLTNVMQSIAN